MAEDAIEPLRALFDAALPEQFRSWPVRFYRWQTQRVEHHVEVTTATAWFTRHFGFDPWPSMSNAAWLATPQQMLPEATVGPVFHDDTGELTARRAALRWYPEEVWRWLLACQWQTIQEQESFVGRATEAGDDLGARLVTAHLVRAIMRLCFLQDRQYAPYAKWLGSAFARLACASAIAPALHDALAAPDAAVREDALARACEAVARRHNALDITLPIEPAIAPYAVGINDAVRPYRTINAVRFAEACREAINDERLRGLPLVGGIDQLTGAGDLLTNFTDWPAGLRVQYQQQLDRGAASG